MRSAMNHVVLVALCGLPLAAHAQTWTPSNNGAIYLNNATGAGQVNNLVLAGTVDDPNKVVLSGSPGLQIQSPTGADVSIVDSTIGTVTPTRVGDVCLRIIAGADPQNSYGGSFTINVRAIDKSLRTQTPVATTLTVLTGQAQPVGNCSTANPPIANPDTANVDEDSTAGVTVNAVANDTDADGDTITVTNAVFTTGPQSGNPQGDITGVGGNGFTFTPRAGFSGTVNIVYSTTDGTFSATGQNANLQQTTRTYQSTVTITVNALPDAPDAVNDTATVASGGIVLIPVLANDTDQDGDTLTISQVSNPNAGTAIIVGNQIEYRPGSAFAGTATFTYTIDDGTGRTDTATVTVIVGGGNAPPTVAITGAPTITVPDTNQSPGETVTINTTASDPEQSSLTWTWVVDDGSPQQTSTGSLQVNLTDGTHTVRVSVSDGQLSSSDAQATVVVVAAGANNAPTVTLATTSGATNFSDSDGTAGESVQFRATASDSDGTINTASYRWTLNSNAIAALNGQSTVTIALPDGNSSVGVTVADNSGTTATAAIQVSVSAPVPTLQSIAATPNQAAVGQAVDVLCPQLNANAPTLSSDATDLLVQCARIIANSSNPDQQRGALDALTGEQLQAAQTASLNFGKLQAANIVSRMTALRQGATGVSIAGLNLSFDGQAVPLAQIASAARALGFGIGGGSGDDAEEEAGDLKSAKLGLFLNGKVGFGDRDTTANETGYDFDSIGATLGADYRFRDNFVAGVAVGYSSAEADFDADSGELESRGLSGTVFSTLYSGPAYLDLLATYGSVNYDSERRIRFNVGNIALDRTAVGDTDGTMMTLGIGGGYDITRGGWVITPNASVTYMKVKVDGFTETGAQGLDLEFGDQDATSTQYQGGVQVAYNYSAKWGVISPQVYGSYVRDNQDLDSIFLRFANDPFTSDPNQPGAGTVFFVTGDEPDESYFRWGASLSAIFGRGLSAFVNYESYAGLRNTEYSEITFGVRVQRAW